MNKKQLRNSVVSFYEFNKGSIKFREEGLSDLTYMNLNVMLWIYVPVNEVVGDVYSIGISNMVTLSIFETIRTKVPLSSLERLNITESILEEI